MTQPEIDDVSEQFAPTGENIINWIDSATGENGDTIENREKIVTSYYYKFYPRQELIINDTSEPIRVRIPNPSNVDGTIDGKHYNFRYELNNYLLLERDEDNDSAVICSDLINDPDDTDRVKEKNVMIILSVNIIVVIKLVEMYQPSVIDIYYPLYNQLMMFKI